MGTLKSNGKTFLLQDVNHVYEIIQPTRLYLKDYEDIKIGPNEEVLIDTFTTPKIIAYGYGLSTIENVGTTGLQINFLLDGEEQPSNRIGFIDFITNNNLTMTNERFISHVEEKVGSFIIFTFPNNPIRWFKECKVSIMNWLDVSLVVNAMLIIGEPIELPILNSIKRESMSEYKRSVRGGEDLIVASIKGYGRLVSIFVSVKGYSDEMKNFNIRVFGDDTDIPFMNITFNYMWKFFLNKSRIGNSFIGIGYVDDVNYIYSMWINFEPLKIYPYCTNYMEVHFRFPVDGEVTYTVIYDKILI